MNFFNRFFHDLFHGPTYLFARRHLLLPVIIFFAIVGVNVAGHLIVNGNSNLHLISGKLERIEVIVKSRPKGSDDFQLRIFLQGQSDYYFISAKKKKARFYQENLQAGDSLFIKVPAISYKFLSADPNMILDLRKTDEVLFNFQEFRDEQEIALLIIILSETFFIWLFYRHKKNKPTYV